MKLLSAAPASFLSTACALHVGLCAAGSPDGWRGGGRLPPRARRDCAEQCCQSHLIHDVLQTRASVDCARNVRDRARRRPRSLAHSSAVMTWSNLAQYYVKPPAATHRLCVVRGIDRRVSPSCSREQRPRLRGRGRRADRARCWPGRRRNRPYRPYRDQPKPGWLGNGRPGDRESYGPWPTDGADAGRSR